MEDDWERYGQALLASMAEVLVETDPEGHPLVLETANYWLALGLSIGIGRREEAKRLLELMEAHEGNRTELAEDGRTFVEQVLR